MCEVNKWGRLLEEGASVPDSVHFGQFMLDHLRLKKNEVALINAETHKSISYEEVTQYAVDLSAALTKLGVKKGDVVALGSERHNFVLPTLFAIVFSGGVFSSFDLNTGRAILKYKLQLSKPKYFISTRRFWDRYKDVLKCSETIELLISFDGITELEVQVESLIKERHDLMKFEPVAMTGSEDPCCIQYSSGTTGFPKGIIVTHFNCILSSAPQFFADIKTALVFGEWFHTYDTFISCGVLAAGKKVVYIRDDNSYTALLKSIQDYKVDIAFVVATTVSFFATAKEVDDYDLSSLKMIYSSASPLGIKIIEAAKQRLPSLQHVLQGYAMTEASVITCELAAPKGPRTGSVGVAFPRVTIKIIHPETGKEVGVNECGEIYIAGPNVMKGYIGADKNTYLNAEGFYRTGDFGHYDSDGYYYIVDRLKEIIQYDGYKVSPAEMESILLLHPAVQDAAVVGKPHELYDEVPLAFVVKSQGTNVTEQELVDYVAGEVSPYMQLRGGVRFVEDIPRNSRGKIMREELRKRELSCSHINNSMLDIQAEMSEDLNFGAFLLNKLRKNKNKIAMVNAETREEITYKELTQHAINVSLTLTRLDVAKDDVVAVGSEKHNLLLPTLFGIIFSGGIFTCYDFNTGKAVLKYKLSLAQPKFFICTKRFWDRYEEVLRNCTSIKTFIALKDGPECALSMEHYGNKDVDNFKPKAVQGQKDSACLFYSSGTTGMPKAINMSHQNCIVNSTPYFLKFTDLKTAFVFGEWYHTYDTFIAFAVLTAGRKVVYISDDNSCLALLKSIQDYKVDTAFVVPTILNFLAFAEETQDYNLDSLKTLYSRCFRLPQKTIEAVRNRFPNLQNIAQGYAMTEASVVTCEMAATHGPKPGSVGMPLPGRVVKIVHPETLKPVGANEYGEIYIKGPNLMKGYLGIDPRSYLDDEGFYKTGDFGYYDDDGYYYIVDRLKEIIQYDGYKVSPTELESILRLHPSVLDAGVVGTAHEYYEEVPVAFVVKKPDVVVTAEELIEYVAKEVAPYMQLRGGVRFVANIPRNQRGKVLRVSLKNML